MIAVLVDPMSAPGPMCTAFSPVTNCRRRVVVEYDHRTLSFTPYSPCVLPITGALRSTQTFHVGRYVRPPPLQRGFPPALWRHTHTHTHTRPRATSKQLNPILAFMVTQVYSRRFGVNKQRKRQLISLIGIHAIDTISSYHTPVAYVDATAYTCFC